MADHQLGLAVNGREHQLRHRLIAFPLAAQPTGNGHANGNGHGNGAKSATEAEKPEAAVAGD